MSFAIAQVCGTRTGSKRANRTLATIKKGQTPRGWKEIDLTELADTHLASYSPDHHIHATVKIGRKYHNVEVFIFWDGTGIAFNRCWKYEYEELPPGIKNFMCVKVYRFGCVHAFTQLTYDDCKKRNIYHGGSCYHVLECSKCGHVEGHDSSD